MLGSFSYAFSLLAVVYKLVVSQATGTDAASCVHMENVESVNQPAFVPFCRVFISCCLGRLDYFVEYIVVPQIPEMLVASKKEELVMVR